MAIRIMLDSASDMQQDEAKKLGIIVVPMTITFEQEEFLDGETLLTKHFYERLISCDTLPKTSQINVYMWEEEFEKYTSNGDKLIVITISSTLSGTYDSAVQAQKKFGDKVYIIDSQSLSVGETLLGIYAQQLVDDGMEIEDIVATLNDIKYKVKVLAVLDTLEYLKRGGRISSAVALVGKILSIKPVVTLANGKVTLLGKAIGKKNGISLMLKCARECGVVDMSKPYSQLWSGVEKQPLEKHIADAAVIFDCDADKTPLRILGCAIGTHIGPGAVGVAFFAK